MFASHILLYSVNLIDWLTLVGCRAVCMVVYTGKETKLSLNSKAPPSKLSVVDSVVNRTLIIAISAMMIVCVMSAIAR